MDTNIAIKFKNVTKKISNNTILKDVNLSVYKGETVGIIGSNGSGKTTILRLAAGFSYANGGEIYVFGEKLVPGFAGNLAKNTAALIETPHFLPYWSGFNNLFHLSKIRNYINRKDIEAIMNKVGLDPQCKQKVRAYSLGMRQRLGLAQAFMEKPSLILLDEPTNGLDKEGVKLFSALVEDAKKDGASIIFVSHHDNEIRQFCDRVFKIENCLLSEEETYINLKIKLSRSEDIRNILKLNRESYMETSSDDEIVMIVPTLKASRQAFLNKLNKQNIIYEIIQES